MKYKIVIKFSVEDLEKEVNHEIAFGWEPIGGVSFQLAKHVQAMVKKEEVKRKKK